MIRPYQPSDLAFVRDSWACSLRWSYPVKIAVWRRAVYPAIMALLTTPGVTTAVACDDTEPSIIHGYIVYEAPAVVHYLFVKGGLRRLGIGRKLLDSATVGSKVVTTCPPTRWAWHDVEIEYDPFRGLFRPWPGPANAT